MIPSSRQAFCARDKSGLVYYIHEFIHSRVRRSISNVHESITQVAVDDSNDLSDS
jgi:hypothetical protein